MMTVRTRQRIRLAMRLAAAVAVTLFFLFPIYWLFMISFKTRRGDLFLSAEVVSRRRSSSTTTWCCSRTATRSRCGTAWSSPA